MTNWDVAMEETAQRKRERTRLFIAMIAGDSMAIAALILGILKFLDWIIAIPFIVLGWGYAGYMMWRFIRGRQPGSEQIP
jgi:hypothetical protein